MKKKKLFFIVSEDRSFWSHRLSLALSAIDAGYNVTLVSNFDKLESKIKKKGINPLHKKIWYFRQRIKMQLKETTKQNAQQQSSL